MKLFLVFCLLCIPFTSICQLFKKSDIVKFKIKSIVQKDTKDSTIAYRAYNKKGMVEKEIIYMDHLMFGYNQTTFFSYINDSLLSKEIISFKLKDSLLNVDTTFYDYDKYGRLEFIFSSNKEHMLTKYIYGRSDTKGIGKRFWQMNTYSPDSTFFIEKKACHFQFKNSRTYYLFEYEMYNYYQDEENPISTNYFKACSSNQDKINQTFCLSQTRNKINFGDTLTQFYTVGVNIKDNTIKENIVTCDKVDYFAQDAPALTKIESLKLNNNRVDQATSLQLNGDSYSSTENYFYDTKGLLVKIESTLLRYNLYPKQTSKNIYNFTFSFYDN
jgi:hypothetical protein